jgi:hypothetical protein
MNWERHGSKQSCPILRYYHSIWLAGWRKSWKSCQNWLVRTKMSLFEKKSALFEHAIHFFMVLLTFETGSDSGGYVYFAVLLTLSYVLTLLSDSLPICTFILQCISSHATGSTGYRLYCTVTLGPETGLPNVITTVFTVLSIWNMFLEAVLHVRLFSTGDQCLFP